VELQTLSDKALQSFNLLIVGKPSPVVGKAARCIAIAPTLFCARTTAESSQISLAWK